jgi:hypothetical protein
VPSWPRADGSSCADSLRADGSLSEEPGGQRRRQPVPCISMIDRPFALAASDWAATRQAFSYPGWFDTRRKSPLDSKCQKRSAF